MMKPGYSRNIIHIITRYSNLPVTEVKGLFERSGIYADKSAWARFSDLALLAIGAGFLLAGVIFFFAYNWQDMHKFLKLGMLQAMVAAPIVYILVFRPVNLLMNILLTVSCVLTGVLFAVFGQIYQTGADAYDLFLGWTVFIALWALSVKFEALWLIFLALVNVTFILYVQQAGPYGLDKWLFVILYVFNAVVVSTLYFLGERFQIFSWLWRVVALYAVGLLTIALVFGAFENYSLQWFICLALGVLTYAAGFRLSIQHRSMYLLCVLPVSIIIVLCALFIDHVSDGIGGFIFISFFIMSSVTLLVRELLRLNKKWHAEGL